MADPVPDRANEDAAEDACAALERMAGGDQEPPSEEASRSDGTPPGLQPAPAQVEAAPPSFASPISSPAPRRNAQDSSLQLKKVAVPPMAVMAGIMFLLGVWAILALCGHSFLTDEPNEAVDRLARVMLLCWPVGGLLVVGIAVFRRDINRSR